MNSNENKTTVEFNPPGEQGIQAITLAKKAIESVRNDISCKNAVPGCKKCGKKHPTFHSCGGMEKAVKSKELTKKVIELICGNISTKKSIPKCEPGDKNHQPLYPRSVESEKKTKIPVATINRTEEKGQAEAKSTELPGVSIKTATCQCCDNEGIGAINLVKIDSGQLLCPDCLKSLRKAAAYKTVPHR
ncbi:MAG: hypothetical protein ACYTDW_05065 [Planctomycetota bacterium]|jgi:hypothetical protein